MTRCHVRSLSSYAKTAQSWKFMKYSELEIVENMAVIWSQTEHHHLGLYFPNFIVYTGWDHRINSECFKNAGCSTNSAVISLSLVGIREFTTLASWPTNFLFWFQMSCFFFDYTACSTHFGCTFASSSQLSLPCKTRRNINLTCSLF